jgi:hypothetical protein
MITTINRLGAGRFVSDPQHWLGADRLLSDSQPWRGRLLD